MCLQCLHNGEDILVIGFQRGDMFYPKSDQVWVHEAISFLRMAVNWIIQSVEQFAYGSLETRS